MSPRAAQAVPRTGTTGTGTDRYRLARAGNPIYGNEKSRGGRPQTKTNTKRPTVRSRVRRRHVPPGAHHRERGRRPDFLCGIAPTMVAWTSVCGTIAASAVAFGAWKLHGFLQGIRKYRASTMAQSVAVPHSWLQVLEHARQSPLEFFRINDEVMGGKSTSALEFRDSSLVFSGTINTNGGGFASARTLGDDEPLGLRSGTQTALLVDVTGDGQRHKLTLHTADSWTMTVPVWTHDFIASQKRTTYRLALRLSLIHI